MSKRDFGSLRTFIRCQFQDCYWKQGEVRIADVCPKKKDRGIKRQMRKDAWKQADNPADWKLSVSLCLQEDKKGAELQKTWVLNIRQGEGTPSHTEVDFGAVQQQRALILKPFFSRTLLLFDAFFCGLNRIFVYAFEVNCIYSEFSHYFSTYPLTKLGNKLKEVCRWQLYTCILPSQVCLVKGWRRQSCMSGGMGITWLLWW